MKRSRAAGRHLDSAAVLDYLEQRLPERRRQAVEEHLGRPCAQCRERVRETGRLLDLMRADRSVEVPAELRRRALEAFVPRRSAGLVGRAAAGLARLLFDSALQPLPAAVRRAVGEARRLRFALDSDTVEVECELESAGSWTCAGSLRPRRLRSPASSCGPAPSGAPPGPTPRGRSPSRGFRRGACG